MQAEFVKVYDLRDDSHNLNELESTLKFRREGGSEEVLIPAHLTPSSPGWWEAIESGAIRAYTAEGVISSVYDVEGSRMSDIYYAFDIDEGHRRSTWDVRSNQTGPWLYWPGNRVRVRFLLVSPVEVWEGEESRLDKEPLEIWIAPTARAGV